MIDWLNLAQGLSHLLVASVSSYGAWVYGLIFAMIFLQIGVLPLFILPGNPFLVLCGALAAAQVFQLAAVLCSLFAAAVLGSLLNFSLARVLGRRLEDQPPRWLDQAMVQRTRRFCERYGRLAFLLTPYIGVVRTLAPFVAGAARMNTRLFVLDVTLGAALWVSSLVLLGYQLGRMDWLQAWLPVFISAGIALGIAGLLLGAILHRLNIGGNKS